MAEPLQVHVVARRVHPAHGPGGLERHVFDQVRHLAGAGVRVTLWSETAREPERARRAADALADLADCNWIAPGPLPFGNRGTVILDRISNYPWWAHRVARRLGDPAGIVHVHGLAGVGVAASRRRGRLSAPIVLTTHGMEEFRSPPLKHLAYAPFRYGMRRVAAAADRVIVTDRSLVPEVRDPLRVDARRLLVIPNVIVPEECVRSADAAGARALLEREGLGDADPLLVSVGRLEDNKGFDLMADALARSGQRLPESWAWVVIGEGSARGRIARRIARGGIADRCRLLGRRSDAIKHGLLSCADWFVHPTRFEGSSLVTLEAMAHGLPVLAARAGGLPDKVRDGITGILVTPDDVGALQEGLVRTRASDPEALGAAGRALVHDEFSWAAITPRFLDLYRELATHARGRRAVQ